MSLHDFQRIQARLGSVADPVAFLTNLFANAPVGFAVWDAQGHPILTNRAFLDIFHSEPPPEYSVLEDELLAANGMLPLFQRAFAGETVRIPTFWYDPREHAAYGITEGHRVAVSATIFPLFKANGEIDCVAATYKDETDIVLAAEQLRATEERQRAAEQEAARNLERSDARYRRLAESGIMGIMTADFLGNILEANQAYLDIVGYSREEVLSGRIRWAEMTPPEWRELDQRAIAQLKATGVATPWEKEYIRKDGRRVPILVGIALLEGASGQCVAFVLDLTERKRAEEALRTSERLFRGFKESGVIGIVLADTAGKITEANDAFLETVGYTREDFEAGRVTGSALNPPDRERTDAVAFAELEATGVAHAWEKELVRKDGTRVPILNGVVLLDEHTHESVAFVLDLTERKRAEAAARESEARKAAVMEAALDAIVLMDHAGAIIDFNPAAERTFGYAREEVLGKPLADLLIPTALRAQHRAGLERYLQSGEGAIIGRRVEVSAVRRDGTEFPAEVAVLRIRSAGDPVFTGYIRDITERRQAAEAEMLRREKDAAQAANRELEAFSYSVAHDLRSPLRGISGFSGALLEDHGEHLDADAKAQLQRIMDAGQRMGEIIDALLSLARLSRTEVRRERVDLTAIARSVIEQLRETDPTRSVEFVADEGVVADGDPALLRVVVENLIGNAWKFTRREPRARIEFRSASGADGLGYFVRDNGAGFDMRYANRLFSPFQRLHATEEFEGTGVGLATIQRIVRRHGGRVWGEGKENGGATFQFTLWDEPAEVSWKKTS